MIKSNERALETKQRQHAITRYIPQCKQYTTDKKYREESSDEEVQQYIKRKQKKYKGKVNLNKEQMNITEWAKL